MSSSSRLAGVLDRTALATTAQVMVRVVIVLATVVFTSLTGLVGGRMHPVLTGFLLLLALAAALLPDSAVPLLLILALTARWALSVPDPLSWWTLVAAFLLLLVHLAATLGGYGPPAAGLAPGLLALWARRAVVMAAATVLVWLLTVLLDGLSLPRSPLLLGAGLAVVLAWTGLVGRRLLTREPEGN